MQLNFKLMIMKMNHQNMKNLEKNFQLKIKIGEITGKELVLQSLNGKV